VQALGVTLIELLCVMGIIGILMSMMAPAAFKALKKARQLAGEIEAPAFQDEIQRKYTPYRLANPQHPALDRNAFIAACVLSPKAAAWLRGSDVQFFPFSGASAPTTLVIEQRLKVIPNQPQVTRYTVVDLLLPEPE
jgi:prepilin-type N-terminal cleavage/methylation domain-containing protein